MGSGSQPVCSCRQVWLSRYIINFTKSSPDHLILTGPVTEDLVRYMGYAIADGNNFLVDDPQWAIDFAPNGISSSCLHPEKLANGAGTLLGLNDTITRKRYAEYELFSYQNYALMPSVPLNS